MVPRSSTAPGWLRADEGKFRQALALRGLRRRDAQEFLAPVLVEADQPSRLAWETVSTYATDHPEYLDALRAEGVRDADIAWYWGLGRHVRFFLQALDNLDQRTLFLGVYMTTGDEDAAKASVQRHLACYSRDFLAEEWGTQDDRRLPWELRDRVDVWIARWSRDPAGYRRQLDLATTFNAAVRENIRFGHL